MPEYTVRDSHSGRTVTLRGDSPPTETELEEIFSSLPQQAAAKAATPAAPPRTWGQAVNDALPAVGGAVGGIIGAGLGGIPASAGGAAIGGAAGKGFQGFFSHAAEIPGALKDIASNIYNGYGDATVEGFKQGMVEGGKSALGRGAVEGATDMAGGAAGKYLIAPAARGLIKTAYRPTLEALKINPNIAQDILDKGIGLSKKGLAKAEGLTSSAKQYAESLVDDLTKQKPKFIGTPAGIANTHVINRDAELLDPVFFARQAVNGSAGPNAMGKVAAGADNVPGLRTADSVLDSVLASVPREITPQRALAIKRAEGRKAASVFTDTPDVAGRKSFNADLHDAADEALSRRIGPAWNAANKETQKALSIQKMVEDAINGAETDSHMPLPYDQWLLLRGLANGNPGDIGLAMAREAGRIRPLISGVGHAVNASKNAVTHTVRGGRMLVNEEQQADAQRRNAAPVKSSQVNSLYDKYKAR
jgi:hypothetical protein